MFELSKKLKFAIKVSLSMVLAFLIPFSQGLEQAQVAAITIMLIASIGPLNQSIQIGAMRVLGTLIGAVVGLSLIALFPQDRILYLISLSLAVTFTLYLVRAYKGDSSVFMLSAMTMMMVFDNGAVDDVFLFAVDKVYMSIFGILVYSFVGTFLWPEKQEDNTIENAKKLSQIQAELFLKRDLDNDAYNAIISTSLTQEQILQNSSLDGSNDSLDLKQWQSITQSYKRINKLLALEINHHKAYQHFEEEITTLLKDIQNALESHEQIKIPPQMQVNYDSYKIEDYSHLKRASFLSEVENLKKLHFELSTLAHKLNTMHSPLPTFFEHEDKDTLSQFIWGDVEHIKASLVTFCIFWVSTFIWITFNPPAGFMIVTLATGLSVLTVFTPLKPSILITIFTLSFIFAVLSYVFILPNLHYAWELALFIFFYSFVSFYFLPPKLTVFFLIGMFTLGLANEMNYNFSIFLSILLMFYIFLIILQFFSYIPFSMKPEYLFLRLKNRLFYFADLLFERSYSVIQGKSFLGQKVLAFYARAHLINSVNSMQLWASKLDLKHFTTVDKDKLESFLKESKNFAYFLNLLYTQNLNMKNNLLILDLRKNDNIPYYSMTNNDLNIEKIESSLTHILSDINFDTYPEKTIIDFYENINLRKNVWMSYFKCKTMMSELDFKALEESRF